MDPLAISTCFEWSQPPSLELASKSVILAFGRLLDRKYALASPVIPPPSTAISAPSWLTFGVDGPVI